MVVTMSVELRRRLQELVDQHAKPDEPGLVVGLCRDGQLVATATAGLADIERSVPMTEQNVFDIASSSKQICATVLLLLERDGLLSLDDPLADHLAELRLRERVTLRQCLQHTAGLREYFSLSKVVGAGPDSWKHEQDVVRVLLGQLETDFAPSTDWSYSNTGYVAAAAVVRTITGKSLSQVAADRIFAPLGMRQTCFDDRPSALVPNRATGYVKDGENFRRADGIDGVIGDGGVLTTVADAAKWLAFVADGRVLGQEVREALLTRTVLLDGEELPYCLGVAHESLCGRPAAGHGGAAEGYRSHLTVTLDGDGLGVIVMANRSDVRTQQLAQTAASLALGESDDLSASSIGEASADEDVLGLWLDEREMAVIRVARTDNGLALDLGDAKHDLEPVGPGRWALPIGGPGAALVRRGEQLVMDIGVHSWRARRMRRIDPIDAGIAPVGVYLSRELNAIATITEVDGKVMWRCAAGQPDELEPLSVSDHWNGSGGVLVAERDAHGDVARILVNSARMRRVAFEPVDRSTYPPEFPLGFPVPFGGPPA